MFTLRPRMAVVLLLALTVLAYLPALFSAFVYDDFDYVVHNRLVTEQPTAWGKVFTTSYPPDHPEQRLYRPLVTMSYILDRAVWGLPARPNVQATLYHLTNLAWHLGAVLLVFVLIGQLTGPAAVGPGLAGAALFALHPLATESVAWVSGRAEVMAAALGLVSLVAVARVRSAAGRGPSVLAWVVVAGVAFGGAVLSKENAVVVPGLAVLVWLVWPRRPAGAPATRRATMTGGLVLLVGYAVVASSYLLCRHAVLGETPLGQVAYGETHGATERLLVASKVLLRYLGLILVPYRQSVFHEVRAESVLSSVCAVVLLAGTAGLAWWAWRRRGGLAAVALFGWAWVLVALLPVANLLLPIGTVMAERFLYLPLAGVGIAVGLAANRLAAAPACGRQSLWVAGLAALLAHHAVKTPLRCFDWTNDRRLWSSAVDVYPASFICQAQLGFAWLDVANWSAAAHHLERAMVLLQARTTADRQAFEPRVRAALARARVELRQASPELEAIHRLARSGQLAEAAVRYRQYWQNHPTEAAAGRALADCLLQLQQYREAAELLRGLVAAEPDNALLHGKLGLVCAQLKEVGAARESYLRAIELNPSDVLSLANLAGLELGANRFGPATEYYERAVRLRPDLVEIRLNLALCYLTTGEHDAARREAEAILRLDPQHAEAVKVLQQAQRAAADR